MGIPILTGDISAPFTFPSVPPLLAPAIMLLGTTKVLIAGRSVMTLGAAQTSLGAIVVSTLFTTKTFIEGSPAHLAGAVAITSSGWLNGVLQGTTVTVLIN